MRIFPFRLNNVKTSFTIISILLTALLIGIWITCKDWSMLAGISTWVLAMGVLFAIWQIRLTKQSMNAQLAVELFRVLRDPTIKDTLSEIVYSNRPSQIKNFTNDVTKKDEVKKIEYVLNWFDMLGALVIKGIVNKQLAIEAFAGRPALRCWYQLAPYIRQEQKNRGTYA